LVWRNNHSWGVCFYRWRTLECLVFGLRGQQPTLLCGCAKFGIVLLEGSWKAWESGFLSLCFWAAHLFLCERGMNLYHGFGDAHLQPFPLLHPLGVLGFRVAAGGAADVHPDGR